MTASEIINVAEKAGVRLRVELGHIIASPKAAVSDSLRALIRSNKNALIQALVADVAHVTDSAANGCDDALPDPKAEARRQRVLHLAWSNPDKKYAVHSDDDATEPVMLAVAIRKDAHSVVTCEVAVPKAKYEGFKVMELVTTGKLELAIIDGSKAESNAPESSKTPDPEPVAA